jgi:osmotically-inducible protein OsmY
MSQHPMRGLVLSLGGLAGLGLAPPAIAQTATPAASSSPATAAPAAGAVRPEVVVFQALRANPITAPYWISTSMDGKQVVLAGKVGTKRVHDEAVRTAIAIGYPVRDNLTIDTAEAHRVAAAVASGAGNAGLMGPGIYPQAGSIGVGVTPQAGPMGFGINPAGGYASSSSYIYPRPLFGRLDDPFFGFEPPLISYAPWYRGVASYRDQANMLASMAPAVQQGAVPQQGANQSAAANPPVANPGAASPPAGANAATATSPMATVEMTINPQGVAVLRGTVATLADRIAIGQTIAQQPGVTEVQNLLNVAGPQSPSDTPPPPPQPAFPNGQRPPAPQPDAGQGAANAPVAVADGGDLSGRLAQAIARRPALANLPIKVTGRDGVAYLSGTVPTVYEAMLAFRAAQQTPGVHAVDDRLTFEVPDGERPNPLRQKGRPEDIEPYLAAQVRRQLGDLAHVDQVRLLGDTLEIRGTLLRDEDRPRLAAILRSMPVLRGFRVEPTFQVQ